MTRIMQPSDKGGLAYKLYCFVLNSAWCRQTMDSSMYTTYALGKKNKKNDFQVAEWITKSSKTVLPFSYHYKINI